MSWIIVIWSAGSGASLMLGLIYLLVWSRNRRSWANLCFSVVVFSVLGLAIMEMLTMHAESPEVFGRVIRWTHLVYAIGVAGSLGFVHFYFGTGRKGLLALALGMRLLAVLANFTTGMNLHIGSIHSLTKVTFLGEQVSILGEWVPNPWMRLGWIASLTQLSYVVDASVRLWRTGSPESKRRAGIVGGALAFFIVFAVFNAALVTTGVLRMPLLTSIPFLGMLLVMGHELSRDVMRATRLGRELEDSEQRMALATEAANLGCWSRDLTRNEIWASNHWRGLFDFTKSERIDFDDYLRRLHEDDREAVLETQANAINGGGSYQIEYRVMLPDGGLRWIASRGGVEFDASGNPLLLRGVSVNITERKLAEQGLAQHRNEVAHLSRVTTLGGLGLQGSKITRIHPQQ